MRPSTGRKRRRRVLRSQSPACPSPNFHALDLVPLEKLPEPALLIPATILGDLPEAEVIKKKDLALEERDSSVQKRVNDSSWWANFRTADTQPSGSAMGPTAAQASAQAPVWREWGLSHKQWKYIQLFSGFLMNMLSWGIIVSYGTFLDLYDELLGEAFSDGLLGMVGGTQVLFVLFWSLINGRLVDAGYHRWVMLWGLLTLPLSFGLLSYFAPQRKFWMIWLFGGFGVGWGAACFGLVGALNIVQWFPTHNCIHVGIVSSGGAVGGVIFPLVLDKLVKQKGVSIGLAAFAGIITAIVFTAVSLTKQNPSYKRRAIGNWKCRETWFDTCCFGNRSFNLYTSAIVVMWFGYASILYHIPQWVKERQELKEDADIYLAWSNLGSLGGRIFGAVIAHTCLTMIQTQASAAFACVLTVAGFWNYATSVPATAIFCVLYGLIGGTQLAGQLASIGEMLGKDQKNCAGSWMGMMWIIAAPFAVTGPTIGGEIRKRYGLRAVGYFSTACFVLAAFFFLGAALSERHMKMETTGARGQSSSDQATDAESLQLKSGAACRSCNAQGHHETGEEQEEIEDWQNRNYLQFGIRCHSAKS